MKKSRISAQTKVLLAALCLVIVFVIQFVFIGFGGPRDMRIQETEVGVSYSFDASPSFYANNSRFFYFLTRNGIRLISSVTGNERWHQTFNLTRPTMQARGDFVAVGEEDRGREIFVFNADGPLFQRAFDTPVLTFSINETGFLSVIRQLDNGGHAVEVFTRNNITLPLYVLTLPPSLSLPVAVDVSPDGRYIVIAYLDMAVTMMLRIEFRFINREDARDTDNYGLFAQETFANQFPLDLRFMQSHQVLLTTDAQIVGLQRGTGWAVEQMWSIPLNNHLDQLAFYGNSRFAFVAGDAFVGDRDALPMGDLRIFNMNGEPTGAYSLGRRATFLDMGHNALIVGTDRVYRAIDFRGNLLWEHIAMQDTRAVIFLENTDTFLQAGATRADVWRRQRVRNEDIFS